MSVAVSENQACAALFDDLHGRLNGVVKDAGGEQELIEKIAGLLDAAPDLGWDIAAVIQQRYRQGDISAELFHSLASKIAGRELSAADYGTTVGLSLTCNRPPAANPAQYPSSTVEIGRVLRDRYVLEKRLGRGGMGTVFKARDRYRSELPESNQYVAIKILHGARDNPLQLLSELKREFYCAQMLSHPNIVKVYELDRDGDVDFFTMEFLDGELLSSVHERFQPLPMCRPHAWAIIREIGAGLAHAHARGVMHADLKPHNIMITQSGEVRILDFGASSTKGTGIAQSTATPAYACCELLDGRAPDRRDDTYAFACVSYELLVGAHPFQRRSSTVARDLRIVPIRPAGLNRRQWKALAMGLSWHRAGRSISVPEWLKRMDVTDVAISELPNARDLRPAAAARPIERTWVSPLRAATILATVLIVSLVWVLSIVLPSGEKVGAGILPAATAARTLISDPIVATGDETSPPKPAISSLASGVDAPRHKVRVTDRFAEIRLHRSAPISGSNTLVWWTEAASAKPGVDYVPQDKVTRSFAKGETSASFFIKLVPKAARSQSEYFYLAVAEAGLGSSSGKIARTAVWLPATHDQS